MKKTAWRAVMIAGLSALAGFAETLTVVSDTNAKYFVADSTPGTFPVAPATNLPSGWNTVSFNDTSWSGAAICPVDVWMNPNTTAPFSGNGAKWISVSDHCVDDFQNQPDYFQTGDRGLYLFRRKFNAPGTALNLTATAALGADNYGFVYLNGTRILDSANLGIDGNNIGGPPATAQVPVTALACQNVLAVEVQNGGSTEYSNSATGAIFSLTLTYDKPKVAWSSPAENEFVKGGQLQIKFGLTNQSGVPLTGAATINVAILGPGNTPFTTIAPADLSSKGGSYSAKLKVSDYPFQDGVVYTAVVTDSCNSDVIGSVHFTVKAR